VKRQEATIIEKFLLNMRKKFLTMRVVKHSYRCLRDCNIFIYNTGLNTALVNLINFKS